MTDTAHSRPFIRVRGRSFMALVLVPEPPVAGWLAELDAQMRRSPSFFEARPVVLDLSGLPGHDAEFPSLVADLQARSIRIIGIEGAPSFSDDETWTRPSMMASSRADRVLEIPNEGAPADITPPHPEATSLLLDHPVRSGQSVVFERGDVTIIGSVASGAEIIAGGSIHVYGTLRGRAIAGLLGQPGTRIFCRRLEAELLAIDGLYKTADDMESGLRGRAIQAWLQGDAMMMAALD